MNTLSSGSTLKPGDSITSANGRYRLELETTGDLVLTGPTGAAWKSGTWGQAVETAEMQTDGNFVMYGPGRSVVWRSDTTGQGAQLVLQDDRNLVVLAADGTTVLWSPNCFVTEEERGAEEKAVADEQARRAAEEKAVADEQARRAAAAPPPPAPAPAAPAPRTYTVVRGDTLSAIAKRFYGNAGEYRRIAAANNIANPDLIHPGQHLTIPD